jgi:hypothetical protein
MSNTWLQPKIWLRIGSAVLKFLTNVRYSPRRFTSYKVTDFRSWNRIKVPGVITSVPAVCPYRA